MISQIEERDEAGSNSLIQPLSTLPGRVRWQVNGLRDSRKTEERIVHRVSSLACVKEVRANHLTGRVLILFDDQISVADFTHQAESLVHDALIPQRTVVTVERKTPSPVDDFPGLAAAAAGGAGIGLAFSLGPVATLALALTASSGLHVIQKARVRFKSAVNDLQDSELKTQVADLIRPHRKSFLRAVMYDVVSNLMGTARIFFLGGAITAAVRLRPVAGGLPALVLGAPKLALFMAAGAFGTLWLRARFRKLSQVEWHKAVCDIQDSSRVRLYQHVQRMESDYFQERQTHQILHALSDDINRFDITGRAVWDLIDVTVYSSMLLTGVVIVGGPLVWLALVPIPIIVGISAGLYPSLQLWYRRVRVEEVRLERSLRDGIAGIETIKSFTSEGRESERIADMSGVYRDRRKQAIEATAELPILLEIVFQSATTVMYLVSSRHNDWVDFRIGTFVSLNRFVGTMFFHLSNVGPKLDDLERGIASLGHMSAVLGSAPPEDAARPYQVLGRQASQDIVYKDVHFAYPGSRPVFDGLSLKFAGGKTTAIVGLTGSGKSTLVKLLLRYYTPQKGTIEIGGVDLAHVPRSQTRSAVSVVSQDVFLFDRSVSENISLYDPDANHEQVEQVAQMAQAHRFISRLPNGYDEILGERGALLSGGERQRIAIARSLMKNAPIVVFDEATSALDSNTEMDLQEQLIPLFDHCTVIIIAHRLSTVRHADCIYLLEDGCIVEEGTHDELVSRHGQYRALWKSQLGEAREN